MLIIKTAQLFEIRGLSNTEERPSYDTYAQQSKTCLWSNFELIFDLKFTGNIKRMYLIYYLDVRTNYRGVSKPLQAEVGQPADGGTEGD